MTLTREKHANFFPQKVYRCPCLLSIIDDCHENDLNSFIELHDAVWDFVLENGDIWVRCLPSDVEKKRKTVYFVVKNI